jgi:hypothetical protein
VLIAGGEPEEFSDAAHILLCVSEGTKRIGTDHRRTSGYLELNVTQSIKSTNRRACLDQPSAIVHWVTGLESARCQLRCPTIELSTPAIFRQIELRKIILRLLDEVSSDLARQMFGIAARHRSRTALGRRNVKDKSRARAGRLNPNNGQH